MPANLQLLHTVSKPKKGWGKVGPNGCSSSIRLPKGNAPEIVLFPRSNLVLELQVLPFPPDLQ